MGRRARNRSRMYYRDPAGGKLDGVEVIVDEATEVQPPSYRVSPGAWLVANLFGRIMPLPHVAYWPLAVPGALALTPGGAPIATYHPYRPAVTP